MGGASANGRKSRNHFQQSGYRSAGAENLFVYGHGRGFGQIGGEEFAYTEPFVEEGPKGPAVGLKAAIPDAEIVATIIWAIRTT